MDALRTTCGSATNAGIAERHGRGPIGRGGYGRDGDGDGCGHQRDTNRDDAEDGVLQIFNLPIGVYTVTVTQEGFEKAQYNGIAAREAQATTVNAALKVGQTTESVEVTANPMLNATDATNGFSHGLAAD